MKKYKIVGTSQVILLILFSLFLSKETVEGFNVGVRATSCSLDPSDNNNACASLYEAECDGKHCRCPSGTHEDKTLKKCVRGAGPKKTGGDDFGDLPFDYVPGKKPEQKPKATQSPPVRPNVPAQPQAPVEGGYNPNPYNPNPRQPGGYPEQPPYNPNQPGFNPNQAGRYPPQPGYPNQPGYNPYQPPYNPNQPGYNPNQPAYNPNQPGRYPQPGYNPNQPGKYAPQPGYNPNQPSYPGSYDPNRSKYDPKQPGGYNPGYKGGGKGTYTGDPHMAEKTGGGIGGGIGLLLIIGLIYFCCCRGEKGKNIRGKLPFFRGGGSQPGANYQMQPQQPDQYPNAPPPAGGQYPQYPQGPPMQQPYYPQPNAPSVAPPAY